jgi:hypothetical protein
MSDMLNKIMVAVNDDPVIYTDMVGTNFRTVKGAELAKKMDSIHTTMRLGMVKSHMEDWCRQHPNATYEQGVAAAGRYFSFVNSNPSFFKRVRLGMRLLKRTDLQTSLEP